MKSPYPYFGGKSRVADLIWSRFGDVKNYIEPFFGSGAVLLYKDFSPGRIETINDLDCHLANFWRAVKADPDAVGTYASDPVNEVELHARGDWLFYRADVAEFKSRMLGDPDYYCARSAGWWVWGLSSWIGNGWGGRRSIQGCPHLADAGMGVNRQLPHLGNAGMGVNRQLPHLADAGRGVTDTTRKAAIIEYMREIAERVSRVRVCCGDWSRVCTPTVTTRLGLTAMLLDPPYSVGDRADVYAEESYSVAHDVREYAVAHGHKMRIALCGYGGEHDMPQDWECVRWKAAGGYESQSKKKGDENMNRHRECIWFSPCCIRPDLFAETEHADQ